jgi:hypothetical protein
MIRVCFSMLLLMMLLSACASENPKPTVNAHETTPVAPGKNILACTGLPIAGQKCGLEFPKI